MASVFHLRDPLNASSERRSRIDCPRRSTNCHVKEKLLRHSKPLLMQGNAKVGGAISIWSLPAVETCPGASSICQNVCYAKNFRYRFPSVRRRLEWNLRQSRRDDFGDRMVSEIRRCGALVLRLHGAGDFYDAEYCRKWLSIIRRVPRPRFFGYTRSWKIPEIAAVLEEMASLRCVRLWYSFDDEMQPPERTPKGVRLAYLQTSDRPPPRSAQLVFRTRKLRRLPSLPTVCASETPEGKQAGVTCGSCGRCFQ